MRECRTSGSVRGVLSNGHPYRNLAEGCHLYIALTNRSPITGVMTNLPGAPVTGSAYCDNFGPTPIIIPMAPPIPIQMVRAIR